MIRKLHQHPLIIKNSRLFRWLFLSEWMPEN